MKKNLFTAAAAAAALIAGAAQAATVTIDFEGVAPPGGNTPIVFPGQVAHTEDGFDLTATLLGTVIDEAIDPVVTSDVLFFDALRLGYTLTATNGAAFDFLSFDGQRFFADGQFRVDYTGADGTTGSSTFAVTAIQTFQTFALDLTNIVSATFLNLGGTQFGLDNFVLDDAPTSSIPVPGALLLFGPAIAGLMAARRRAA